MEHVFRTRMLIPATPGEVFPFFSDAWNLERITPPELEFRITTPGPIEVSEGTIIEYRLLLYRIPFSWRARISTWEPPHRFVDEQIQGPYLQWIHAHCFIPQNGGTVMEDEVRYRLPFFPLGEAAWPLVHWQVRRIFRYRREAILRLMGNGSPLTPAPRVP